MEGMVRVPQAVEDAVDCVLVCLQRLPSVGLSAVQTGMDNVRNMTGSPIAGIDPHELIDIRKLNYGAHAAPRCLELSMPLATHNLLIVAAPDSRF